MKIKSASISLLFLFVIHALAHAGGLMLYEISTADTRLASAGWSSRAEDPSTLFTNPAGMTRILTPALESGGEPINAHVIFNPNAGTTVKGSKGYGSIWLPSGSFFYVHPLNDCVSVGFGALGYIGADLNYNSNWVGRYYVSQSFLDGFSAVPAAAYRINEHLSIGLGANIMYGIFHQRTHINNSLDGLPDGRVKLSGGNLSAGCVAGVLYEFSDCTRIGIQYLSPVKLEFHDKPKFTGIGPTLETFLTLTGLLESSVEIIARVPQNVILSLYHAFNDRWSVMVDGGWQQWSRFQRATISLAEPNSISLTVKPKYLDTWHAALGAQYRLNPSWLFSGGIAYDSSAVSNKERMLDFPVGEQWRFGSGARWTYRENLLFDLCYEFMWSGNLPVNAQRGPLAGRVQGNFHGTFLQFISANITWGF